MRVLSRREFLRIGSQAAAAVALGARPASGAQLDLRFHANPFRYGVASGDPLADGVVLWTRLDPGVLDRAGLILHAVPVRWEIAEDEGFKRIVRTGAHVATAELGHSVHAEVDGLRPGRPYWYRFNAGGEVSTPGRTRTAPANGSPVDAFRFAFVSCQSYENGYFTAFRRLADEDLELVVHLGDYIYETATLGPERAVRLQEAPGEAFTLDQYRARYAHYKADEDLQEAHARFPFIAVLDDHEVKNDWAGESLAGVPPEEFLKRRAAAFQAYYEFLPLRRTSLPSGPFMRLYRRVPIGTLAHFHVLDTRQHRSGISCGGGRRPQCLEALSTQDMIGPAQEKWLLEGLRRSPAGWNLIANQVMMAQFAQTAGDVRTFPMDNWNGYVPSRTRLLKFLADHRPANPVVMTGDIHNNWVADLKVDFDDPKAPVVATELVGTSIVTGGDGDDAGRPEIIAANPHFKFFNNRRGYVRCTVTPNLLTSDFRTVSFVSQPGAPVVTRASFVVENGRPGAQLSTM